MNAPEHLYRIRSLNRLLDDGELEKQEMFFAPPSLLNDPVEGYLDVFWKGDQIVWKNLFKNYLICLEHVDSLFRLGATTLTNDDIPVFLSNDKLPTDEYKKRFSEICGQFFSNETLLRLIKCLGERSRPVRRDEMIFHLTLIHPLALHFISSIPSKDKAKEDARLAAVVSATDKIVTDDFLRVISSEVDSAQAKVSDAGFKFGQGSYGQKDLLEGLRNPTMLSKPTGRFILIEFPKRYVEQLERLIYPPWYATCFMESVENASLWGHYGDGHRGVCLKFRTAKMSGDQCGLNLNCITSYSASKAKPGITKHRGNALFQFYKIKYDKKYPEIDFFQSIGRLPVPQLIKGWYTDEAGQLSPCSSEVLKNQDHWRRHYWERFYESNTIKLEDWNYEREYRLLLTSSLNDLIAKEDRLLKYDFSVLEGVIFGIKTPYDSKVRILEILKKKCLENKLFNAKIFQAAYSHDSGKIEINELADIKFGST